MSLVLVNALGSAFVVVDHLRVVHTHEVHDSGVEVVDVEFVFHSAQTEFIGLANG